MVECQMMIRKPISDVFEAFVNPDITTNFWFTKSTGRLEQGKRVTWYWEMYNVSSEVDIKVVEHNTLITIDWGEPKTSVDFKFSAIKADETLVIISAGGYTQTGEDLYAVINDNTGGFTTVLDGCKAYLEHGINLNLIADKFPTIDQK